MVKKVTKRIGRAFGASDVMDSLVMARNDIRNLNKRIDELAEESRERERKNQETIENLLETIKRTHDITKIPPAYGDERLIQEGNLILFKTIKEKLEENNITYFLNFGILIGMIRHGGFVPWDDDIDIEVPREDFEKLPTLFDKIFEGTKLKYVNSEIMRVFYGGTPLQLDIFPIDFAEKNLDSEEKSELKTRLVKYQKSLEYNWDNLFLQKEVTLMPYNEMRKKYYKMVQKKNVSFEEANAKKVTIINSPESPCYEKTLLWDFEDIFPLRKEKLCGVEVCVPNNIDKVLRLNYGDYYEYPRDMHKHSDIISRQTAKSIEDIKTIVEAKEIKT